MSWMLGTDTHHARNDNERWAGQFNIIKATEGSTFVDPEFKQILLSKEYGHNLGVYHFLSEKSGIAEQIEFFVSTVEPLKGKALLALDYEAGFSAYDPTGRCLADAINQLRFRTNAQMLIYMNKSDAQKIYSKQFAEIVEAPDVCLWLADYSGNYRVKWKPVMRQVCTSPCDIDVFYGSNQSFANIVRSWK